MSLEMPGFESRQFQHYTSDKSEMHFFFFMKKKKKRERELFLNQVKVTLTWATRAFRQGCVYCLFKGKLTSKRTKDWKTILCDTITV